MFNTSMNFDLGEDVNAIREMVHRFAQDRIKPIAAEVDQKNAFPNELWKEFGELGLLGVTTPEEYGGSGLGLSEAVPGRSALLDGFGLVAFAALFPIISVLAYGQLAVLRERVSDYTEHVRHTEKEENDAI